MTSPLSAQKKAALPLFLLIAGSTSISSVFIKLEHLELAMKRRNIAVRPFSTIPFFFFFSSLSACSLWLWHYLGAVCMLNYM